MAMTKAEKARMEELEIALALCWPGYPEPAPMNRAEIESSFIDIPRRDRSVASYATTNRAAVGWFFNDHDGGRVTKGWTDGRLWNSDSEYGDGGSQMSRPMYRTRRDAAMALRHALSRRYARALAEVDRIIRDSSSDPQGENGVAG